MRPIFFLGRFYSVIFYLSYCRPRQPAKRQTVNFDPLKFLPGFRPKYRQRYIGVLTSLLSGISPENYVIGHTSYVLDRIKFSSNCYLQSSLENLT